MDRKTEKSNDHFNVTRTSYVYRVGAKILYVIKDHERYIAINKITVRRTTRTSFAMVLYRKRVALGIARVALGMVIARRFSVENKNHQTRGSIFVLVLVWDAKYDVQTTLP